MTFLQIFFISFLVLVTAWFVYSLQLPGPSTTCIKFVIRSCSTSANYTTIINWLNKYSVKLVFWPNHLNFWTFKTFAINWTIVRAKLC